MAEAAGGELFAEFVQPGAGLRVLRTQLFDHYISRKARNFDAVLGVVCGVILVCWIVISPFVHANLAIEFGTLLIFLVGFLSANLLNKRRCK